MIQILGLRPNNKPGAASKRREAFVEKKWEAPSLRALFKDPDKYLEQVPKDEHWNIYFTANNIFGNKSRDFKSCEAIWFDIDDVDLTKSPEPDKELVEKVARAAVTALNVKWEETVTVFSGGGIQIFIGLNAPIEDPDFFELHMPHYKMLCSRIKRALKKSDLPGVMDASVFESKRIMRMPNTTSCKPEKRADRQTYCLQSNLSMVDFDLVKITGIPKLEKKEHLPKEGFNHVHQFDLAGIAKECKFVEWAKANPADLTEPQWYALASLARGSNGREAFHSWSEGHPNYTKEETDEKYDQAIENSGPRTCENLDHLADRCQGCKHQNTYC